MLLPRAASLIAAATLLACMPCAASLAAQQLAPDAGAAAQQPAPAPPGTTGPIQPPATQDPAQPPPQTPPVQAPPGTLDPAQPPVPAPALGRVIAADAGVIFLPVKPERVADFEKVMAKLHEALASSQDAVRKEQAAGWKLYKAVEPGPNNTALYVFIIDPAVKGTDYAFWKTMYDAFPTEVQELYRLYMSASAGGQTLLNLQLVQAFGAAPAPPAPAPVAPGPPAQPPTPKIPD